MGNTLNLLLSGPVREVFARVLDGVLRLPQGSGVADFLGPNPWGDLGAFRREVVDPMRSGDVTSAPGEHVTRIVIPIQDVPRINAVLNDFYEGYSGGRPWHGVDAEERMLFERLLAQVHG